jgi:hypothetical protein
MLVYFPVAPSRDDPFPERVSSAQAPSRISAPYTPKSVNSPVHVPHPHDTLAFMHNHRLLSTLPILLHLAACGASSDLRSPTPSESDTGTVDPGNHVDESEPIADPSHVPNAGTGVPRTQDELEPSIVPGLEGSLLPSGSCGFSYEAQFGLAAARTPPPTAGTTTGSAPSAGEAPTLDEATPDGRIAYADPLPTDTWGVTAVNGDDVYLPNYHDSMPLFDRSIPWTDDTRCYELPEGALFLTEPEAFLLYKAIAERTTGVPMDTTLGVRTVVGIRGAFPGTFDWNGNDPDRFNDTLVLLWTDVTGPHVREFPVTTDTGAYNFGTRASSSLRANRRYTHEGGWHRGAYEALTIAEYGYRTLDDTNKNGYLDNARNGWLPPNTGRDYERTGGGHNIHVGSVNGPLGSAKIRNWSAGCQVIPGMANWTTFITEAWPGNGKDLQYFLVDVRDIDHSAFSEECIPDGTLDCPYVVDSLPYTDSGDTRTIPQRALEGYSCSSANEAGPEVVYLLLNDSTGDLSISVEDDDGADIDVYLLDADDPLACLDRDDTEVIYDLTPGRYFIVADTYVRSDTGEQAGEYTLTIDWL